MRELIARGGMGEVWRATDDVLARDVAVKVLHAQYAGDSAFHERFRAEARNAASFSHPGVAQVYDFGETGRAPYLVMELVPGEPLSVLLERQGSIGVARTLDVLSQTARALEAAHAAGVVHRDIKPGNLLVTPDGTVKVTDFGIARAADALPLTATGTVMGSAPYLSPEQASGQPAGPASDVYALGVVAYECLAGHRPFQGDSAIDVALAHAQDAPPPLPSTVPPPLRDLVLSCLAKPAADRPTDAQVAARAEALRGQSAEHAVAGLATAPIAVTPPRATLPPHTERTQAMAVPPVPVPPAPRAAAPVPPAAGPAGTPRRRGRGGVVAATAVAVLLVGGGAVALGNTLLGDGGGDGAADDTPGVSAPVTSPTARPSASATPSPTDEATEEPSPTATDEETAEPEATPTPSPTPAAEETEEPTPSPSPSDTGDADDGELVVDGDALVGRNGNQVISELLAQGLSFSRQRVTIPEGEDASPCTVQRVTPSGAVDPGTTIAVYVWYEPGGDCGPVPGSGGGRAVPQLLLPAGDNGRVDAPSTAVSGPSAALARPDRRTTREG
nr:serine/threonine protein kinase [Motilibacter aurantiacus]